MNDHGEGSDTAPVRGTEVAAGSGVAARARRWIWLAGSVLVVAVAVSAIAHVVDAFIGLWLGADAPVTASGWLMLVGGIVVGTAVVAVAARLGTTARSRVGPITFIVGATIALRLAAIALVASPIESDWANYHRLAIEISRSGPFFTDVPTGWPMLLALPYAVLGADPRWGELLNLTASVITTVLVYVLTDWHAGRRAAAIAGALYAVFPSQILMTVVLGADVIYTTLIVGCIVAIMVALHHDDVRLWVAPGLLLALASYVRPAGLIVLPALVALALLPARRARPFVGVVVLVVTFMAALTPVIAWQRVENDQWSISTSRQSNWNLLVGLNQEHDGFFNADDEALVGLARGTVEFDARAGELARERLLADPLGVVPLAIRKFPRMWGDETYGAYWAMLRARPADLGPGLAMAMLSQVAWALVAGAASLALLMARRTQPLLGWALILLTATTAIAHSFLEIQPRYHAALVPIICCVAAPTIGRILAMRWGRSVTLVDYSAR